MTNSSEETTLKEAFVEGEPNKPRPTHIWIAGDWRKITKVQYEVEMLNQTVLLEEAWQGSPPYDQPVMSEEQLHEFLSGVVEADDISDASVTTDEDPVNHPSHYTRHIGVETIQITENHNFNRGNAIKYIDRAGYKPGSDVIQDLEKAAWYIQREMQRIQLMRDQGRTDYL